MFGVSVCPLDFNSPLGLLPAGINTYNIYFTLCIFVELPVCKRNGRIGALPWNPLSIYCCFHHIAYLIISNPYRLKESTSQ